MPRFPARAFGLLTLTLAAAVTGCGESDTFLPPPRSDLAGPAVESPVTVVEMILPAGMTFEKEALAQLVRVSASRDKQSFRLSTPDSSAKSATPAEQQAELIRKAAARGASVLIVDPVSDPAVAKALAEVRAGGVPAVLLAELGVESDKPFPVVTVPPYLESASQVVAAALEDATTAKLPADRTAVVLMPSRPGADLKACGEALETAAKKAGLALGEPLGYDGALEGGKKVLHERLASDPKLGVVLVVDDVGLSAVLDVRDKLEGKRPLVVAGYARDLGQLGDNALSQTAAVAARDLPKLAQEAYRAAIGLVGKETVAERTVAPDQVRRFSSQYIDQPVDPLPPPGN